MRIILESGIIWYIHYYRIEMGIIPFCKFRKRI